MDYRFAPRSSANFAPAVQASCLPVAARLFRPLCGTRHGAESTRPRRDRHLFRHEDRRPLSLDGKPEKSRDGRVDEGAKRIYASLSGWIAGWRRLPETAL